ncbi:MAG TPA: Gfo/Idh/MocA family oxidoreductase [Candidatus Bathyarchaeota archaeon]|nr:Gfo/Idh/MocA family oxidoreductase [Candidatus Bathyarchaeota archaeon]
MRLGLGIIGCGRATTMFHLRAVEEVEEIEVVAVADRDPNRARGVAEEIGARWYVSHGELLGDGDVEAVAINTPPGLHEEMSLEALKAGRHILCEKPMARSVEGCRRIADEAEERGLVAHPFHNYAHTPILDEALKLIGEGVIGEIECVKIRLMNNLRGYRPMTPFRLQGDNAIIEDLIPHILSVAGLITGWKFQVLDVEGWRRSYPVVDNLNFHLKADTIPLQGEASWTAIIPSFEVRIEGSEGLMRMDLMRNPWTLTLKRGGETRRIGGGGLSRYLKLLRMRHPSFTRQYRHFYRVVRGMETPRVTMEAETAIIAALGEMGEVMEIHG